MGDLAPRLRACYGSPNWTAYADGLMREAADAIEALYSVIRRREDGWALEDTARGGQVWRKYGSGYEDASVGEREAWITATGDET